MDSDIFRFRIGKALVDWVHVDNLVEGIFLALKKISEPELSSQNAPCGHAYFINDGSPIDNFEFLRPLCEVKTQV